MEDQPTYQDKQAFSEGQNLFDQVTNLIRGIEVKLLVMLYYSFNSPELEISRGFHICDVASNILARVISHNLGIPLSREASGPHVEIAKSLYMPSEVSSEELEDQTYLLVHDGQGRALYIDAVYDLLDATSLPDEGEVRIQEMAENEVVTKLEQDYRLYPYSLDTFLLAKERGLLPESHHSVEEIFDMVTFMNRELLSVLHDCRATWNSFLSVKGYIIGTYWSVATILIEYFAPGWESVDIESKEGLQVRLHYIEESYRSIMEDGGPVDKGEEKIVQEYIHCFEALQKLESDTQSE